MNWQNGFGGCHCSCMIATCSPLGIYAHRSDLSHLPYRSSLCVVWWCDDYSCRTIESVSPDHWTVIAQLSTTHRDVSGGLHDNRSYFWLLRKNNWKESDESYFVGRRLHRESPLWFDFSPGWARTNHRRIELWVERVCCGCVLFVSRFSERFLDFFKWSLFSLFTRVSKADYFCTRTCHHKLMNRRETDLKTLTYVFRNACIRMPFFSAHLHPPIKHSNWMFSRTTDIAATLRDRGGTSSSS